MAIPALPTQGSTSWYPYAQGLDSAARAAAVIADVGTANTPTGDALRAAYVAQNADRVVLTGSRFGLFGAGVSARVPMGVNPVVDATTAIPDGSANLVGIALSPSVTGDFTGITGSDPGQSWGLNLFAQVAAATRNLPTVTGGLAELAVLQDGGNINTAIGFAAGLSLYGATAGATVNQGESLRVTAPTKKDGAVGGAIVNAYGLFVEEVTVGTNSNISLFVAGGTSRFSGRVDVQQVIVSMTGALNLQGDYTNSSTLNLQGAGFGGNATLSLGVASSLFNLADSTGTSILYANKDLLNLKDGLPLNVGTTNGSTIGASTSQKIGFHGATPTVQLTGTPAAATDLPTALALVNDLRTKFITKGLIA